MSDLVLNGREIDVKSTDYTDVEACPLCGEPMELVSIEEGYNCTNEECELHMAEVE
jgi:hypothetical protein